MTVIARREYRSTAARGPWAGADVFVYPDPASLGWHVEIIGWNAERRESYAWDQWTDNDVDLREVLQDLGIAELVAESDGAR